MTDLTHEHSILTTLDLSTNRCRNSYPGKEWVAEAWTVSCTSTVAVIGLGLSIGDNCLQ